MSTHHNGRRALRVLCLFAFVGFAGFASAQTLPQEYSTLIRSDRNAGALDASLLGERIDYYTGRVEFVSTDVSLPGNNALPVAVGRRYVVQPNPAGVVPERDFGDWDLDVPHIEGLVATSVGWTVPGANPNARCSAFAGAPDAGVTTPSPNDLATQTTTMVPWEQYSTGYRLVVPGYGRRELLKRAPNNTAHPASGNWPIVTNDWWMVSCAPTLAGGSPGAGEGFVALAPDGTKYTFDWLALRPAVPLSRPADTNPPVAAILDREAAWMMATKVEDRFGNWVKYAYDPSAPLHLKAITSSDGRAITLTYLGTTNSVQSISDGSRTWSYAYTFNGAYYSLSSVTGPDASKWQISFDTLNHISWSYPNPWSCGAPGTPSAPFTFNGTIAHPSGALGQFTFTITRRGRNGAPATCYTNSENVAFASVQPGVYDTLALTQKKITGPGLATPLTWSLAYAGCSGSVCSSTVTTTVTDPRGDETRYTFGTGYNDDEGLLLEKESGGSGASYLQTETYQYFPATGQSYPALLGTATQSRGDTARLATLRPLKQRTTTLQGTTFTYTASSLDAFGNPQSITRAGSATKAETVTYANNASKWIVGTVQKVVSSGSTELDRVLNAFNEPITISRFGDVDQAFGYNADGTLQWAKDGNGHATTYANWYRGIPKNVGYATGESASVTVSNIGTIDSHTDERGSVTTYDHDAMGRVSGIHYPAGDPGTGSNQAFAPTTIVWSTSAAGWQSTETTDADQTITKYDALLRPILVNENNARYLNTKYDGDGGPAFVSVPSTLPNEGSGTTFQHDALGRVTQQSFVGYITSFTYQAGFITRISDPNATTYIHYLTHDEPSTAWPVTIDGPLYTTNIARDAGAARRASVAAALSASGPGADASSARSSVPSAVRPSSRATARAMSPRARTSPATSAATTARSARRTRSRVPTTIGTASRA